MVDEPAYIRNFKAFTRGHLTVENLPALEAETYGTNDRARAVMLSSVLENSLAIFLRSKTRPTLNGDSLNALFDYRGPLGDFAAKTAVAYAFNWFGPDTKHDLELVRLLRNEFAHSRKSFGFETPEAAQVCRYLRSPEWPGAFIQHAYLNSVPADQIADASDMKHPRTRYIAACHIVAERLLTNAAFPASGNNPEMP